MMQEEIQTAIYEAVAAIGYPTYDDVPQVTAYPYIVVGDDRSIPFDTDNSVGSETTCTIHVWSQYRGRKEVKEIMRSVYQALHRANLTITGGHLVECQAEFEESFLDPDGLTRHGVIRFRLIVEENGYLEQYLTTETGVFLQSESGHYLVAEQGV
jgi:hypothetical protein